MKKLLAILFVGALFSCKNDTKKDKAKVRLEELYPKEQKVKYPKILEQILEVHGGLTLWRTKNTLEFSIGEDNKRETHFIDLHSRKDKIFGNGYKLGYNGRKVWLLNTQEDSYKGDPAFYHNLMFYFYAMPFVFADEGIKYGVAEGLEFEGRTYPGLSISYHSGVGASYKDEYYIHYDPLTFKMVWLGYSVSYRIGERSDRVNWIRYNDWTAVNNMLLPKSITWYTYEDGNLTEPRNTVTFNTIKLEEDKKPEGFYSMPEEAEEVEVKKQS